MSRHTRLGQLRFMGTEDEAQAIWNSLSNDLTLIEQSALRSYLDLPDLPELREAAMNGRNELPAARTAVITRLWELQI